MTYHEFLDELTPTELENYMDNIPESRHEELFELENGHWWLGGVFVWDDTIQGHNYWDDIDERLGAKFKGNYHWL